MENKLVLLVLTVILMTSCEKQEILSNDQNIKTESLFETKSATDMPYAEILITHFNGYSEIKKKSSRACFASYFDATIESVTQCNTNPNTEILRFRNTVLRPTTGHPTENDDEDEQKPPPLYLEFNSTIIYIDQLSEAASNCGLLNVTEVINCDNPFDF